MAEFSGCNVESLSKDQKKRAFWQLAMEQRRTCLWVLTSLRTSAADEFLFRSLGRGWSLFFNHGPRQVNGAMHNNGVAIFARPGGALEVPDRPVTCDAQGRALCLDVLVHGRPTTVVALYAPAHSAPARRAFFEETTELIRGHLQAHEAPPRLMVCGDFNSVEDGYRDRPGRVGPAEAG